MNTVIQITLSSPESRALCARVSPAHIYLYIYKRMGGYGYADVWIRLRLRLLSALA